MQPHLYDVITLIFTNFYSISFHLTSLGSLGVEKERSKRRPLQVGVVERSLERRKGSASLELAVSRLELAVSRPGLTASGFANFVSFHSKPGQILLEKTLLLLIFQKIAATNKRVWLQKLLPVLRSFKYIQPLVYNLFVPTT